MKFEGLYTATPPGEPDLLIAGGRRRFLDRLPDSPRMAASLPRFREAYPVTPEAKWRESDQFAIWNPPVLDQVQSGCTGHAFATAFWMAWVEAGFDPQDWSPTWAYALCNGGQDQGAAIADILDAARKFGICSASTFPESKWFAPPQGDPAYAEAALAKVGQGYVLSTWEEAGTAIDKGFQVEFSVMVGATFLHMDSDGFAGLDAGPGNHAVTSAGIRRLKGKAGLHTLTSWGPDVFDKGKFFIAREHVLAQSYFSGICIETVVNARATPPPTPSLTPEV